MIYSIYTEKVLKKLTLKHSKLLKRFDVIFFLLLLIFLLPQQSYSFSNHALNFLLISPGTKANGMAGAYTAIAHDVSAMYYNPAGLSRLKFAAVEYDHGFPEFKDFGSYHFFGAAIAISEIGGVGIGYKYISLGKQQRTDEQGRMLSSHESYEWSLFLSYGTRINKTLSVGVSASYNYSHLSSFGAGPEIGSGSATVLSFDIGFIYDSILNELCYSRSHNRNYNDMISNIIHSKHRIPQGLSIGLAILNMGNKVSYIDQSQADPLPQNLKLGIAWNFYDTDYLNFLVAFDAEKLLIKPNAEREADPFYKAFFTSWTDRSFHDEMNEVIMRFGIEVTYGNWISIRLGRYVHREGRPRYWSYGISIGTEKLRLSFSWDRNDVFIPLQPKKFIGLSFVY